MLLAGVDLILAVCIALLGWNNIRASKNLARERAVYAASIAGATETIQTLQRLDDTRLERIDALGRQVTALDRQVTALKEMVRLSASPTVGR